MSYVKFIFYLLNLAPRDTWNLSDSCIYGASKRSETLIKEVSGDQLTDREGPRGREVPRGLLDALFAFLDAVLRWVKAAASPVLCP